MQLILLVSILLLNGDASGDPQERQQKSSKEDGVELFSNIKKCTGDWEKVHRGCYLFSKDKLSWNDANIQCENRGGDLISISDVGEKTKIVKQLKTINRRGTWWVGLQRGQNGFSNWLDGGEFGYRITKFKRGEPNNDGGNENCVEVDGKGQLNDKNCHTLRNYICEKHKITPRTPAAHTAPVTTPMSTRLTTAGEEESTMGPLTTLANRREDDDEDSESQDNQIEEDEEEEDEDEEEEEEEKEGDDGAISKTKTDKPTTTTTSRKPTTTTTKTTTSTKRMEEPDEEEESAEEKEEYLYELYSGCYFPHSRHSHRKKGQPFLYHEGSGKCPPVRASGAEWGETQGGMSAERPCRRRKKGMMTFYCGGDGTPRSPTCWRGDINEDDCASPKFKKILSMIKISKPSEDNPVPPEPEETVSMMSQLAEVTESAEVTEEDIAVTSKVIQNLVSSGAMTTVKDKKNVTSIVKNVMKAGSNLVSPKKSKVWTNMEDRDKIRKATSLLVAMEKATVAMAEEIDEPTTIVTKDENIELELRVLNVSCAPEDSEEEVVYNAKDSANEFSIPVQTLNHLSQGGLAKVVFMTHYSMGDILEDSSKSGSDDEDEEEESEEEAGGEGQTEGVPEPTLASYILSASVGGQTHTRIKLPRPVSFTMGHIKNVPVGYHSLCSFWNIEESGMGEWSQDGCRVVRSNASQTTCECDHMTNFAVLMAVQEVELPEVHVSLLRLVTIIGCIISCLCLLASWVTFTCFTALQGERNSIHKNLVVCLFIAELLFLTGIDQTQNRLACGLVAGLLQYFFLATFLWMMLEGVHIVLMLVQVFDASRSRMPYYYAAAYGPPVLIIAISAGFYYDGYGTDKYCWLTTERYFIWSFAGPVAVILFVNSVILIYAMTMVCRHSEYVFGGKEKTTASGIRTWLQGCLALEVLLGLTWIIGFFFLNQQSVAVAYVFTALNSTQGLFIFLFHCLLNKKARKEYRRVMKVKRRPSTSGSGSGTHTASLGRNKLTSGPSFNKHSSSQSTDNPVHV